MTDTSNLGLPVIEAAQAQKQVTHNEALRILDTLVQLAVLDRDLNSPPGSPGEGERWIVKASPTPTGAWSGHGNHVAAWQDGGWQFSAPKIGWTAYVVDENMLVTWDGAAWVAAVDLLGAELQNIGLLGVGTMADTTNPFSAKLNNTLWAAKTVAEGGTGDLRYKLSKESAAKTLSYLFQDNFSGRAEIGLTGDDDFHFKTSADGSAWVDALLLDKTTGSTKVNSGFFLTGDLSPAQITADQNDYNPTGLSTASVLRLSTNATRNITGLAGGGDGRIIALFNVGSNNIVLKNQSASSSAANRFLLPADVIVSANQSVLLHYDATQSRWLRPNNAPGVLATAQVAAVNLASSALAFSQGLVNGTLVASVASNALTIAIKTLAGADPSASDPVYVIFRNATGATGDYAVVTLTAATSLVVSSGSTLGTASSKAFRIWIVGFNDAGTFRLGVVNCRVGGSSPTQIFALDEWHAKSSSAEGGAGAADSAATFYTGSAVSSKALRILGFMDWNSGLATAGTWSGGPDRIQLFGPGINLPGSVVQAKYKASNSVTTVTTSTYTATALTDSFAMTSSPNIVRYSSYGILEVSNSGDLGILAMCKDGSVLGPGTTGVGAAYHADTLDGISNCASMLLDAPGDSSSHTYDLRIANMLGSGQVRYPANSGYTVSHLIEELMG